MIRYIINRLSERSTWLGLIALLTACGATVEPALSEYIISAGVGIAGAIGVITKDKEEKNNDAQ